MSISYDQFDDEKMKIFIWIYMNEQKNKKIDKNYLHSNESLMIYALTTNFMETKNSDNFISAKQVFDFFRRHGNDDKYKWSPNNISERSNVFYADLMDDIYSGNNKGDIMKDEDFLPEGYWNVYAEYLEKKNESSLIVLPKI